MKAICSVCGTESGSTRNTVCKTCRAELPTHFSKRIFKIEPYELGFIHNYESNPDFKRYERTSGLGRLGIDEAHGLISIDDRKAAGKSIPFLIKILDIDECGLYPTNVKANRNRILCDAEFCMRFVPTGTEYKFVIKRSIVCEYRRIDATHVEWVEPTSISFLRNIINTTFRIAAEKYADHTKIPEAKNALELVQAKALYMLDGEYTLDELKQRRNLLSKAFHPDVSGADTHDCEKRILDAFQILKLHAKEQAK